MCKLCGHRMFDHSLDRNFKVSCPVLAVKVPMGEWNAYGRPLECARTAELLGKRLMPYMHSVKITKTKLGAYQCWARKGDTK